MPSRFAGWPPYRVAMTCAVESGTAFPTALGVLFKGKPAKTIAARRVVAWARAAGVPIEKPETKAKVAKEPSALDELEARIAAAEKARK